MYSSQEYHSAKSNHHDKYYYFTGFATASLVFLLFSGFLGYKIGFSNLLTKLQVTILPQTTRIPYYKRTVNLPDSIVTELIELNGVVGNAGNPTKVPEHNTIAVQRNDDFGFVLRKNVELSANVLNTLMPFNFDPPVLYLKKGAELSTDLQNYIKEHSRLSFRFSTDKDGFTKTVPAVEADDKILMIGNSVAFSAMVDDEFTISSHLQQKVGKQFRIVNAGVSRYDGKQALKVATALGNHNEYSCLIYIVCQNDFPIDKETYVEEAIHVLEKIKGIADKFDHNVIIFLHTYMEYSMHDLFLNKGWSQEWIASTDELRRRLPEVCLDLGFQYHDWTDIVQDYQTQNKSIFSRFALYVDHCHLSPLGNRLASDKLYASLNDLGLLKQSLTSKQ